MFFFRCPLVFLFVLFILLYFFFSLPRLARFVHSGRMGPISLQIAPESTVDEGQLMVPVGGVYGNQDSFDKKRQQQVHEEQRKIKLERARVALETAKERGLELPPIVTEASSTTTTTKTHEDEDSNNNGTIRSSSKVPNSDIGKGMFDGW